MRIFCFATIICLIFCSFMPLFGQWAKVSGSYTHDFLASLNKTDDGGFVIGGGVWSYDAGGYDLLIMKLNPMGVIEWRYLYGGAKNDYAEAIQTKKNGDYIVLGNTQSSGSGNYDLWILNLDSEGAIKWQKTYGGDDQDLGWDIQKTKEGGYIVAGNTYSYGEGDGDIWVLKLSSNGDIEWQHTSGGDRFDGAYSIQQTSDEGFIVGGLTSSFGSGKADVWIINLSSNGTIEWQYTYGGNGSDGVYSIQQNKDYGFILGGWTESFGSGDFDFWILRLYPNGSIMWQRTYGGNDYDYACFIRQTNDGGFIVLGNTESFGLGKTDFWILKLTSGGTINWQRTYGGNEEEYAEEMLPTDEGGYIAVGYTNSFGSGEWDSLILKLYNQGDIAPGCSIVGNTPVTPKDTPTNLKYSYISPQETNAMPKKTFISPKESLIDFSLLCEAQKHTITISSGLGGTTDPPPGMHIFYEKIKIKVTALPHVHYKFSHWSGAISSLENPLVISVDSDILIKANFLRIVYSPLNFSGRKVLNRSLSQAEYINVLNWQQNPDNENIIKYKIYWIKDRDYSFLAEIGSDNFEYLHRKIKKDTQYSYAIVAINSDGIEGIPAYTTIK